MSSMGPQTRDLGAPPLAGANIFGFHSEETSSRLIFLPVPWEVTVSYREGTSGAPAAIKEASGQVDRYDPDYPDLWQRGFFMRDIPQPLVELNIQSRKKFKKYMELYEAGETISGNRDMGRLLAEIEADCRTMNEWVQSSSAEIMDKDKIVGLIGGDHSTPLGLIREIARRYEDFGILHIDAHADLRQAYGGCLYSHASIMYNVLELPTITRLIQVGVRDYCEEEARRVEDSRGRIVSFYDRRMKERIYGGETWRSICDEIVARLPQHVYLSFDIDGLDPKLCPHTGTPVAGGLEAEEALFLIKRVVNSGRVIVGFDLNEVVPAEDEFDQSIAARLLWRIANMVVASQG